MLTTVICCPKCNTLLGCLLIDIQNCWFIFCECNSCPIFKSKLECWSEYNELSCIFSECNFCQAQEN